MTGLLSGLIVAVADAEILRLCKGCGERFPVSQLDENQRCADCAALDSALDEEQ